MNPRARLAILGYHKVGPAPGGWETWFYVPLETFERHLDLLEVEGWELIDAVRLARAMTDPSILPKKAALLTFDDGYRSLLSLAEEVLRPRRAPAVVFVPTAFVGGANDFDRDVEPPEAICDWEELRALDALGVSVQSHGVSHRALTTLDPAAVRAEMADSRDILETRLGRPVTLFSYPYGDAGVDAHDTARALAGAGYRGACLYGGGVLGWPVQRPFALERIPVGPDTDLVEALG